MMPHLLTPSLTFNRSAIMRTAWLRARASAARCKTDLRAEFAYELRRVWDDARQERALAIWAAEQKAAAAHRANLPANDRAIHAAQAVIIDLETRDRGVTIEQLRAAHARLADLQQAA